MQACHLTCQLGIYSISTEERPLEFDNVRYATGHNQYFFTPYQLTVFELCPITGHKTLLKSDTNGIQYPKLDT